MYVVSGSCVVTVDGNESVTATFAEGANTLSVSVTGNGMVTRSPDLTTYANGASVTLTANPASGWHLDRWEGDLSGSVSPISITMDGNKAVTAVFVPDVVTLTVISAHGVITKEPDQETYTYGTEVVLTMGAVDPGWTFTAWSEPGCTGTGPCTVTMDADKTVTASFTQNEYTLTVTAGTGGSVTKTPEQATYHLGDLVTLTAMSDPGYSFSEWTGNHSGTVSPVEITITGDMTIIASFTEIPCYVPDLIADIEAANSEPDATAIDLDADCTYSLTAANAADPDGYGPVGLPPIITPVTLLGSNTTITRDAGAAAFRLFYVTSTGSLTIENVTLSNGLAQGGNGGNALYDGGGGGGGMGGAIFNRGALSLTNVSLIGNNALGGNGGNDASGLSAAAGGGGMGGNGQGGLGGNLGGAGGGINGGAGGISGSNAGQPGGVGGGGGGAANLGGYGNGGNGGFGGGGGGGNTLLGGIGGFGGGGGGNQTTGSAGGFGGGAGAAWVGGGGAGLGGAIFNDGGTLILLSSTFADNSANGGNGTVGTGATGGGGSGFGGAVFNHLGTLQITNPTFNNNIVVAGTGGVNGNAEAPDVYDLYDLSLSVVGQGSITKDPNQASYFYGQEVTVTATPDEGWSFSAWTGDCAGQGNPCTLTMDGDKTVGATFELNVVSLTINQSTGGTISADPEVLTTTAML